MGHYPKDQYTHDRDDEKGREREKGQKVYKAIMTENILNLQKKTDIWVQKDKRVTNETNTERDTL